MRKLLLRWLINAVGVYVAIKLVTGISIEGDWTSYLVVALVLGLVNALIAPILKVLTCPLILLTLGLFTLIINAVMLWLASLISTGLGVPFYVHDFGAAFWGSLVISIVSFALSVLTGANRDDNHRR